VTAERETVVEVQAPQLVSCFVNETAKKTAEVIKRAQGGVLFVDEAYRLSPESPNDHGRECVHILSLSRSFSPAVAGNQVALHLVV
jgi:SpoVK/Ycf46/Vps4 family AAA+-type ATPase